MSSINHYYHNNRSKMFLIILLIFILNNLYAIPFKKTKEEVLHSYLNMGCIERHEIEMDLEKDFTNIGTLVVTTLILNVKGEFDNKMGKIESKYLVINAPSIKYLDDPMLGSIRIVRGGSFIFNGKDVHTFLNGQIVPILLEEKDELNMTQEDSPMSSRSSSSRSSSSRSSSSRSSSSRSSSSRSSSSRSSSSSSRSSGKHHH